MEMRGCIPPELQLQRTKRRRDIFLLQLASKAGSTLFRPLRQEPSPRPYSMMNTAYINSICACSAIRFATRQLHAGVPVSVVSKLLGHGSISTTLNIYAHVLAEHLEQFERQRAKVLGISGTYRAPDGGEVAEERQVA